MVFSFLMLLAPLAVLGLPGSFSRFVEHYRIKGQLETFVRRVAKLSVALTLLLMTLILIFPGVFSRVVFRDGQHVGVTQCMAITLVAVVGLNFLQSLMEAMRQFRIVTLMRFTAGIMFAVVGTGLMLVWNDMTTAATIGFAISCVFGSAPAIWFFCRYRGAIRDYGQRLSHSQMWQRVAPFAIWLWFANVLQNMFEMSDRYMLVHWSTATAAQALEFVGQYHSGRVIPLLLLGVAVVLEGMLLPYMTATWEENRRDDARKQLNWTIKSIAIGFTLSAVGVILVAPLLFNWVLEGRYGDGLAVLPMTLVYCIWLSLSTVGQSYIWVAEKGRLMMFISTIALVSNLVLNALLIPTAGLWGAVFATTVACLILMTLILAVNRLLGCPTDKGVWITAALPLALLLPIPIMLTVAVVILYVGIRSQLIFTNDEKKRLRTETGKIIEKVRQSMHR
jgi:O-antigen/teichoic acid export membrane protein